MYVRYLGIVPYHIPTYPENFLGLDPRKFSGVNSGHLSIGRIRRRLPPNPRVGIIIRTIMIDIDRWFRPWWCVWGCGVASSLFTRLRPPSHHDRQSAIENSGAIWGHYLGESPALCPLPAILSPEDFPPAISPHDKLPKIMYAICLLKGDWVWNLQCSLSYRSVNINQLT